MDDAYREVERVFLAQPDESSFSDYLQARRRIGRLAASDAYDLWVQHRGTALEAVLLQFEPRAPALSDYTRVCIEEEKHRPIRFRESVERLQGMGYARHPLPREIMSAILAQFKGSVARGHESECEAVVRGKGEWFNATWKRRGDKLVERLYHGAMVRAEESSFGEPSATIEYDVGDLPSFQRLPFEAFSDDFIEAHYGAPLSQWPRKMRESAKECSIVLPNGSTVPIARCYFLSIAAKSPQFYGSAGSRGVRSKAKSGESK